jgi:acyl-CoA reductase-like NAD-dependent aldehyde dehydrogenase
MQQMRSATRPEKKPEVVELPPMAIKADPVLAQVKGDLKDAGVQLDRDMEIYSSNKAVYDNPNTSAAERAEIVKDLITILEADVNKISELRNDTPGFQMKERNPEYKKAMENYVQKMEGALGTLKKARLEYVQEYTKA